MSVIFPTTGKEPLESRQPAPWTASSPGLMPPSEKTTQTSCPFNGRRFRMKFVSTYTEFVPAPLNGRRFRMIFVSTYTEFVPVPLKDKSKVRDDF